MANGLTGIQRGSLVDEVIDRLREQISSGAWPVAARIPPETELIEALGVGRGTVREAVRALAHAGLLEVRRGDGTYVRARSELSGALRREIETTTHDHVQEVRRAIEVEAARLAATGGRTRISRPALPPWRPATPPRTAESPVRTTVWIPEWVEADAQFHTALVAAAGNPLLLDLYLEMGRRCGRCFASGPDARISTGSSSPATARCSRRCASVTPKRLCGKHRTTSRLRADEA